MRRVAALAALMLSLSACSSNSPITSEEFSGDAVVIDVRTLEEYDAGHLDGALHLDWNSGEFAAGIAELDKDEQYLLYCRSGNRAGQAKAHMEEQGFTDVVNLGSLEEAAEATGISIVK